MKKYLVLLLVLLVSITSFTQIPVDAKASKKFTVKLSKCIDGDTTYFRKVSEPSYIGNKSEIGKTRFLYVDTPESTNKIEPYGKTASKFTCDTLKKAKKIELQYDGPKKDKYNRTLAWVWVDGKLLQRELVKKGYVKRFYDYGTYSYEKELRTLQAQAIKKKVGLHK